MTILDILAMAPPPPAGMEPNPTAQLLQLVIMLVTLVVSFAMFGLWLWMLIDCITKEKGTEQTKWALLIILVCCIGAVVYLFVRKLPRDRQKREG